MVPNTRRLLAVLVAVGIGVWFRIGAQNHVTTGGFAAVPGDDLDDLSSIYDKRQRQLEQREEILARCAQLKLTAGPPADFDKREESDRFEPGTKATWIRNATIWTGLEGGSRVKGDILLDRGLVKAVGHVPEDVALNLDEADVQVVDAKGAWVTPGLIDMHSHTGILSLPLLSGATDAGFPPETILPWLRSVDALNTRDDSFRLAIAGGVTSAQILPGSGSAIAGQAFWIKFRKTSERSATSMLIEPPFTFGNNKPDPSLPPRWRHLKQACGENLRGHGTRMDTAWAFRSAYEEARKVKRAQDEYCDLAQAGEWDEIAGNEDIWRSDWEMLVDVLRGRVKISHHCYEELDLDNIVRLSNEFQFHVDSFHHAAEAWLIPERLKEMWGGPPAVAIFATMSRYKRESYRGSEFAAKVLAQHNISVVMKSDHPFLNSRYLVYEAQQAHHYGLGPDVALASVTSTPATVGGLDHRIGSLRVGADADVVIWDSHPLALGATPKQVWIDGIPQLENLYASRKTQEDQYLPVVPNYDEEAEAAVAAEGLAPLESREWHENVVFENVSGVWTRDVDGDILEHDLDKFAAGGSVVVEAGKITCIGRCERRYRGEYKTIDLGGGSIAPGLTTFGSPLGLEEMASEPSTGDGGRYNPWMGPVPKLVDNPGAPVRALDALHFGTREALVAYRSGVTAAIAAFSSPYSFPSLNGVSATFSTGLLSRAQEGAVLKPVTALHVAISQTGAPTRPSISVQIGHLRDLLVRRGVEEADSMGRDDVWVKAARGEIPLIIDVSSADNMATLLNLKDEVESKSGRTMRLAFSGAAEAHLLAEAIAAAGVDIILTSPRPLPLFWEGRRILQGPPLIQDSHIVALLKRNITVGIGIMEAWSARNTRYEIAWASKESNGRISDTQALRLATTNLEKIFGVEVELRSGDHVAYFGGTPFEFSSKACAVISTLRKGIDVL